MLDPNFNSKTWNLMTPNNNHIAIFAKWTEDGYSIIIFEKPIRIQGMTCDPNRESDLKLIREICDRQDEKEKTLEYRNSGLGSIYVSFKDKEVDYLGFDS